MIVYYIEMDTRACMSVPGVDYPVTRHDGMFIMTQIGYGLRQRCYGIFPIYQGLKAYLQINKTQKT